MQVLITGGNGLIGEAIIDRLGDRDDLEFTPLDVEDHPDRETIVADITDFEAMESAVEGFDAVIHLAAAKGIDSPWDEVHQPNFVGTYNVLEAAARAGVEKFIYASSIHAVGLYENMYAPELYDPDFDLMLDHTTPTLPDSFYGLSKVFSENMGRMYVESTPNPLAEYYPGFATPVWEYPKQFYSLRITSVRQPEYDHPYGMAEQGVDEGRWDRDSDAYGFVADRLKATWLSHRDLAQIVECCLDDESVEFDIFYALSDNDGRWLDIDHAREVIGYEPRDNGGEWDAPPADD